MFELGFGFIGLVALNFVRLLRFVGLIEFVGLIIFGPLYSWFTLSCFGVRLIFLGCAYYWRFYLRGKVKHFTLY